MRVVLVVLDSVGIGEMPDSAEFGDTGSDTFGNIIKVRGHLHAPNLFNLGIGKIDGTTFQQDGTAIGCYGKCAEISKAKDTTMGHWEIAGVLAPPFRTFPNGFPQQIIDGFIAKTGICGVLGNIVASGTEIIELLGDAHVASKMPIVYTSADSVFQIAAHENVIPLDKLYELCRIAREMLIGENVVGRVIARPFIGNSGNYQRTENRKDYALPAPYDTVLDEIVSAGQDVVAIGKIEDIFCKRGMTTVNHTTNNHSGIQATVDAIKKPTSGLIFTNLVDFDMLYGHRNNVDGYAKAIEEFDAKLPEIMSNLKEDDLLIITADHGCDPTTISTDHSREYIPVLCYGNNFKQDVNIGTRKSFADIGATIINYLLNQTWNTGESFLNLIIKR